jgi:predicted enzyme related to lactoylglutathione lyase
MAVLADAGGAVFCVWEPGQRQGAQLVNEPGAWSMSQLNTPDPAAAAAFYGAVFGWTTESFGPITMFRLPGYVGGEPHQPVSREVVALMSAAEAGVPPHWSANFWDRDVDATTAKAVELGGAAVAEPFDTPISRMAVIADPHGVSFSIANVPAQATEAGVK